jgi:cytoskeletal protein CcmA (bactofilin family)
VNTANEHHGRAMELADQADVLRHRGLESEAIQVYRRALAEAEAAVWLSTRNGAGFNRLSVLYRSAALLAMDCNEWGRAENLIQQGVENLPSTSSLQKELKDLLKRMPLPVEASVLEPISTESVGFSSAESEATAVSAVSQKGDLPDTESNGESAVQSDVEIKGALRANHNLIFNGTFEGEIVSAGELTLGTSANVHGDVRARSLILFGRVHGNVFVGDTCKLFPSAVLMGDLKAAHLVLEKGASFTGQSQVGPVQPPAGAVGNQKEPPEEVENGVPAKPAKREAAKTRRAKESAKGGKPRKRKKGSTPQAAARPVAN